VVVGGETNGYWRIMGCAYQDALGGRVAMSAERP